MLNQLFASKPYDSCNVSNKKTKFKLKICSCSDSRIRESTATLFNSGGDNTERIRQTVSVRLEFSQLDHSLIDLGAELFSTTVMPECEVHGISISHTQGDSKICLMTKIGEQIVIFSITVRNQIVKKFIQFFLPSPRVQNFSCDLIWKRCNAT